MKKNEDLRSMLEKLKVETSFYHTEEDIEKPSQPHSLAVRGNIQMPQNIPLPSHQRPLSDRPINPKFNILWSENKEALLFGMLASIIVLLIGIFSDREYISMVGGVSFMLFSLVSFMAFFRYIVFASYAQRRNDDLIYKISELERKVSTFSNSSVSFDDRKIKELEDKVAELKAIVKTLSRAAGKSI